MKKLAGPEQIIPAGYCSRCRGCCRFHERQGPWLPHLLDEERELAGQVVAVGSERSDETPFRCASLDSASGACTIYNRRPFECRLYPFVLARRGTSFFLAADTNCPYVAEQGGTDGFEGYARRLAVWLQEPGVRAVLVANTHVFQPYTDVRIIAELRL